MEPSIILYKALPDDLLHRLEKHFTTTQVPNLCPEMIAQRADAFTNAEGLLGPSEAINTTLLGKMPGLCMTFTISAGYDNFDIDALSACKVLLMHTPTVLTETVAGTVMALVLNTAHRVVEVAEWVKVGEWTRSIGPDWFGTDVHHKTLGIVGMGRIGLALAQHAHFGSSILILYNARRHHREVGERFNACYCDPDTPPQESGLIRLILPLTDEAHHLLSIEQFAKMKSSTVLTNVGCSPVVGEKALIAALQKGEIHIAGLGILEQESLLVDSPLLSLLNVVAVPHIDSTTHETRYSMAVYAMDSLIDAL